MFQDIRYAVRGILRQPGFSLAVLLLLTIGLGAVAAGYTVFNGLFIRGWALPNSSDLFVVHAQRAGVPNNVYISDGFTFEAFDQIHASATAADYVAFRIDYFRVGAESGRTGYHTPGVFGTTNIVETLGIPLQLGRGFESRSSPSDIRIVMSDGVWRRVFGARADIIGQTVWVNNTPTNVTGVMGREFAGLAERRVDLIVEVAALPQLGRASAANGKAGPKTCCVTLAGRRREGTTARRVSEELQLLAARYRQSAALPPLGIAVTSTAPGQSLLRGRRASDTATSFTLIACGLILILMLTSANVGNLYLARGFRREREIAARLSLGATRGRIVRQLLTEGLVMATMAGTLALVITRAVPTLLRLMEDNATASMFAADWRVVAFTVLGVVVTCLIVSLAPALHTTKVAWRGVTASISSRASGIRAAVLAAQIAIAMVLVVSATLLGRGIHHIVRVSPNFSLNTTTAVTLHAPDTGAYDAGRATVISAALKDAIQRSNIAAGLAGVIPVSGQSGHTTSVSAAAAGDAPLRGKLVPLDYAAHSVLGIKLLQGRWPSDRRADAEAAINETLARQLWPGESVVGKRITLAFDRRTYTVVGMTHDARLTTLAEIEPIVHVPPTDGLPILLVRNSSGVEQTIRALVSAVDPQLTVSVVPLAATVKETIQEAVLGAAIASGLALVALLLAVCGVFSVFSYIVEERRKEIGIRRALGASRQEIVGALVAATRFPIGAGTLLGLFLSVWAAMMLRGFLHGMSPTDPASHLLTACILVAAALIATMVPMRHAMRVNPSDILRSE